jgi:FixJ family two-component response regulator
MPVMTGLQFISAVRALSPSEREIPNIMLTGHCDGRTVVCARDAGVNEFFGKPVTAKSIIQPMSEVIFRPRGFVDSPDYTSRCAMGPADQDAYRIWNSFHLA